MSESAPFPGAVAREQATRESQSIWFRVMLIGLASAAVLKWCGAPPLACIMLGSVVGGVAAFLALRAVSPVAHSLKASIGSRVAASFGLQYLEFAAAPAALAEGQFKIVGIPVTLSAAARRKFFGEIENIAGSLGLPPASQAALDSAFHFGLLPNCQNRRAADFWSGAIAGGAIELFQLELSKSHSSPNRYSTGDIMDITFHGMVLSVETTNAVSGPLVLCSSAAGNWLNKDAIKTDYGLLARVPLAGSEASGIFAYARDPVEAAALLSPRFVARWQAAKAAFGGADVDAVFRGGKVIAVIPTGLLFQLTSLDPADDAKGQAAFTAELSGLVEGAKLLREM